MKRRDCLVYQFKSRFRARGGPKKNKIHQKLGLTSQLFVFVLWNGGRWLRVDLITEGPRAGRLVVVAVSQDFVDAA